MTPQGKDKKEPSSFDSMIDDSIFNQYQQKVETKNDEQEIFTIEKSKINVIVEKEIE